MTKFIGWIVGIVVLLFIVVFVGWSMLPSWVSNRLTKAAKVPVSIESITLWPNTLRVVDINVKNPDGSILPNALNVGTTTSIAPLLGYTKEEILIDTLTLDNIYVSLEFEKAGSKSSNWSSIMNNLQQETGKKETKVTINTLVLTNINVDIAFRNTGKVKTLKPIKRIEIKDVSSVGDLPSGQIMNIVMKEMLRNLFSLEGIKTLMEGTTEKALDTVKELFSEAYEGT